MSGTLDAVNDLLLYETRLAVAANTRLAIVYKTGVAGSPSLIQVGLAFEDDPSTFEYLDVGTAPSAGWNTATFDLGSYSGRTIAALALQFVPDGPPQTYSINVGRLAIYAQPPVAPAPPTNLTVASKVETSSTTATLRLTWTHSLNPLDSSRRNRVYNVYRRNPDGSLTFLGGTPNNAYFVPLVNRIGNETSTGIEVEAVSPEFARSSHAATKMYWSAP